MSSHKTKRFKIHIVQSCFMPINIAENKQQFFKKKKSKHYFTS